MKQYRHWCVWNIGYIILVMINNRKFKHKWCVTYVSWYGCFELLTQLHYDIKVAFSSMIVKLARKASIVIRSHYVIGSNSWHATDNNDIWSYDTYGLWNVTRWNVSERSISFRFVLYVYRFVSIMKHETIQSFRFVLRPNTKRHETIGTLTVACRRLCIYAQHRLASQSF